MDDRHTYLNMRIDPEMLEVLKREAKAEERTIASLVRHILATWANRKAGARIRRGRSGQ